ncbi:MAG: UDP-2,3-diacylglucosamine diphosphatase [Rikenellaceae bacterium]
MSNEAQKAKYKCIVISDVHLGSKWSAAREATQFIKENSCEVLILCGDIIDGWAIQRSSKQRWKREHTNFMKAILDISHQTRVVYLRGNHDDFLDRVLPIKFINIELERDMIYESMGKRYYVLHGDIFDKVTSNMRWLAKLGDIGYSFLLWYNKIYNFYRARRGLPYFSIAEKIKHKVKDSVSDVGKFEEDLVDVARMRECDGVICGHIHRPEIKRIDKITYLNSGDWVESLSALVESHEGEWSIVRFGPRLEDNEQEL